MKRNNILKALGVLAVAGGFASCSSDYLDLQPKTEVSDSEITTNPTAMRLVINGLCESMYTQYPSLYDFRWFNGEPWFSMVYGEGNGQDYVCLFWMTSLVSTIDWEALDQYNYNVTYIPWLYCYNLVNQANMAISADTDENAENISGELAFRIAQAYTFRAHAYTRLQQIYGPAWDYSNNGNAKSVVIRDKQVGADTDPNMPLSTTNEVYNLIYSDLTRALELYELSEYDRDPNNVWEPNKAIAEGLFARVALMKQDYETAYKMAKAATDEGFTIMSRDEYKGGFATTTSETMWGTTDQPMGLYYASFGATYACNGAYPCLWASIGAGAIDYTFYQKIYNRNDVRCELFFTPDKVSRQMQAQFWNVNNCDAETLDINVGPDLSPLVQEFGMQLYEEIGKPNGWIAPFNKNYDTQNETGIKMDGVTIQFGAQYKFWGIDSYSCARFNYMRVSEMYLMAAEAACHLGNYSEAQDMLYAINSNRITGYTKSANTGDALLEEIKLQRRIELWGEGFSWFDFKRWGDDIVRNGWEAGNTRSGNWPRQIIQSSPNHDGILPTGYNDGWRYVIPQAESQYNSDIFSND